MESGEQREADEASQQEVETGLKSFGGLTSYTKEHLRKWKSLEGDWRTFKDAERKTAAHSDEEKTPSDSITTPDLMLQGDGEYQDEWRSTSGSPIPDDRVETEGYFTQNHIKLQDSPLDRLRFVRNPIEKMEWSSDPVGILLSSYDREIGLTSRPELLTRYPRSFSTSLFQPQNRPELRDVVNSSYPLLKENFSLLQKLKKERDVCKQLESDMINLEGQIQDVSKSFELENDDFELVESVEDSDGVYDSEPAIDSPGLTISYEQMYEDEEGLADYTEEERSNFVEEVDPVVVIENSFARLMLLAERLDRAVRERDLRLLQVQEELHRESMHTISREWFRVESSLELSRIPEELMGLITQLQEALRALIGSKDWIHHQHHHQHHHGERECTSPASFTFQSFSNSQVLVPTVRAIFSQVGNSVELRPVPDIVDGDCTMGTKDENEVFEDERSGEISESSDAIERIPSPASSHQEYLPDEEEPNNHDSQDDSHHEDSGDQGQLEEQHLSIGNDSSPKIEQRYNFSLERPKVKMEFHQRCTSDVTYTQHQHSSSEIIKRIERLQELVRPELCESLKQRALKIQKAKEEFLSGVSTAVTVIDSTPEPEQTETTDIVVEELHMPNGLTVKEQPEEKKIIFPFLWKKKKESWSNEELCRESLTLEDKSDWLRNPFRPKGKYKISK